MKKFGKLTVLGPDSKPRYLLCLCECGTKKSVRNDHLKAGKIISCGCERDRLASERASNLHKANLTHGKSGSAMYSTWCGMRGRCNNPSNPAYAYYGGRGITVCERWGLFENFLADMGEPKSAQTIERIDNNGPYTKENCRWATRAEQQSNRRVNRLIEHNGVTKTAMEWSKILGIPSQTIYGRIDLGWGAEKTLAQEKQTNLSGLSLGGSANGKRQREKTHCKNGHAFDEANTYWRKGTRKCRTCHKERGRAKRS